MLTRFHREMLTLIVVAVGEPDGDGVPTETVSRVVWGPCHVELASTVEDRAAGEVTAGRWAASGPLDYRITPEARIEWRGKTFSVEGEPAHFDAGILDHTEVVLIRWEGI